MDSKKIIELPVAQNLGETSILPVSINMGSFWQTFKLSISALKTYILSAARQVPTSAGGSYKYLQLIDGGDYQWSSPYNALNSVNVEDGPLDARQGKILNDGKLDKPHVLSVNGDSGVQDGYLNQIVILAGNDRMFDLRLNISTPGTIVLIKNNNSVNTSIFGGATIDGVNVDLGSGTPLVLSGAYDKIKLINTTSGWLTI